MSNKHSIETTGEAKARADPPAGLPGLLSSARLPEDADRRCRVASKAAFAIDQLRRERARHRISDVPFGRYLQSLSTLGAISLENIQTSLGLPDWVVTAATAPSLARLARLIELSEEQARKFIRGTFAEPHGFAEAAHRGAEPIPFDEVLEIVESGYSEFTRAELDEVLRAIHIEYDQMG